MAQKRCHQTALDLGPPADPSPLPFTVRAQQVAVGREQVELLVAAIPLAQEAYAYYQLFDVGSLRRGGVYLTRAKEPIAVAPRFDELFADAAVKARTPAAKQMLLEWLQEGQQLARQLSQNFTLEYWTALRAVFDQAQHQDTLSSPVGRYTWEELVACSCLVFLAEETRYPHPRYQGAEMALGRFASALGA